MEIYFPLQMKQIYMHKKQISLFKIAQDKVPKFSKKNQEIKERNFVDPQNNLDTILDEYINIKRMKDLTTL
jgi:hypothetical protein